MIDNKKIIEAYQQVVNEQLPSSDKEKYWSVIQGCSDAVKGLDDAAWSAAFFDKTTSSKLKSLKETIFKLQQQFESRFKKEVS